MHRPVLGYFDNWNITQLSQKSTPSDAFDEIHQVVLDGDKRYIYQLMSTVQLPGSIRFDPKIQIHAGTKKEDVG